MDSLANYGSDDSDDSSDERQTDWRQTEYTKKSLQRSSFTEKQADANYEEVQMDLSEESNDDGSRNGRETRDRDSSCDDRRGRESPNNNKTRDDHSSRRGNDVRGNRSRSKDRRISREEDRTRDRKDDRYGSKSDRYSRDEKSYRKDSYRDKKYRRSSSREKRRCDSKERRSLSREKRRSGSREKRRSGSRDRRRSGSRDRRRSGSRDRRRSGSRDRRRSLSKEKRYSRSPKRDRSRRSRSRSRSRGRYSGAASRRYGYPKNNVRMNDSTETSAVTESCENKNRFFMPGITGKYREQIEKRKLLWQKKDPQKLGEVSLVQARPPAAAGGASTSRVTKLWEATTFAQDQDGKVASKFKRLMGIKGQTELTPAAPIDIIKKQEEMFSSMEQQYEVARTATHTMRGVGLGFSSSYPR